MSNEKPKDETAEMMVETAQRLAELAERLKKYQRDGDGFDSAQAVLDIRNSVLLSLSAYMKQPREG